MSNEKGFESVSAMVKYEKKPIEQIIAESKDISVKTVSDEVLNWIDHNVEQFIDNQKRRFKLDLVIEAEDGATETMPETRKLQNLYRAIPEEPELTAAQIEDVDNAFNNLNEEQQDLMTAIQACKEELDTITDQIYNCISDNVEMRDKIFKHMSFYYEMKGVSSGRILLEELSGEVDVIKFEYESFPMGINVYAPQVSSQSSVHGEQKIVKSYVLPEGFSIWLEIAFKPKTQKMSSLF